ncbi:DNA-binding domain-containing protein [Parabacteroides bouchesdurhonensis]|uniref:DNA-binding domain-containing protein n=1 Tax=Parabacteroides bouchesdurhonensis TaxID=1936995 RepID=UPI000E514901|nr:DNA-binding domain-containing protein [Parabacteroides bouchesdurhonensis]RHJ91659.1 DUF4469 domain-containing protein [Bacteroides sp. AM07-16]
MAETKLYAGLYDNALTEKEGDYTAKAKSTGTVYNADIAQRIVKKRTEYRPETIENILRMADEEKSLAIAEGKTVVDGVGQYMVQIKGVFDSATSPFDHTKHQLVTSYSAGKTLREQLSATEVVIDGAVVTGPVIGAVLDPTTPDTPNQLPFRGMVLIEGTRIALRGTDPAVGITFTPVDTTGGEKPVFITAAQCSPNQPSKLQFSLPAEVSIGDWHVKVATQYTGAKDTKEPRSYEYPFVVSVY